MNIPKPRILQANNYHYLRGGSERYYFGLMELLARNGHDVVHFSTRDERNVASIYDEFFARPFDPDNIGSLGFVEKAKVAARTLYSSDSKGRAEALVRKTRPRLAHCHNIYGALSPSILVAFKDAGLPVVFTAHDLKLICPNHRMFIKDAVCERCRFNRFYECFLNKCIGDSWAASFTGCAELYLHRILGIYNKNIDIIIAPSDFFRRKLVDHGISPSKIVTIPNFIDTSLYEPCFEDRGYFLYFGRLESSKGIGTVVAAANNFKGRADLLIAGTGPMEKDLKRAALAAGADNVKFLGQMTDAELARIVSGAVACIVPSVLYENCPYSVLESFALGKPVIASRIGGIPELVEEGRTGLLFEPGDETDLAQKMEMLLKDRGRAVEMGREARKKVEREYGPELHYERISAVYEKLL